MRRESTLSFPLSSRWCRALIPWVCRWDTLASKQRIGTNSISWSKKELSMRITIFALLLRFSTQPQISTFLPTLFLSFLRCLKRSFKTKRSWISLSLTIWYEFIKKPPSSAMFSRPKRYWGFCRARIGILTDSLWESKPRLWSPLLRMASEIS